MTNPTFIPSSPPMILLPKIEAVSPPTSTIAPFKPAVGRAIPTEYYVVYYELADPWHPSRVQKKSYRHVETKVFSGKSVKIRYTPYFVKEADVKKFISDNATPDPGVTLLYALKSVIGAPYPINPASHSDCSARLYFDLDTDDFVRELEGSQKVATP